MTRNILHIDASARFQGSASRAVSARIVERLKAAYPGARVTVRSLDTVPTLDEAAVHAFFTPADARTPAQVAIVAASDALIAELKAADDIVIGTPIYNFGIPAPLKAWIDQIARAGETFRYTETGPEGLLTGKRAFLAVAAGGVTPGSEWDYAERYLRHVLGFVGVTDVTTVAADRMAMAAEESLDGALAAVEGLSLAA